MKLKQQLTRLDKIGDGHNSLRSLKTSHMLSLKS